MLCSDCGCLSVDVCESYAITCCQLGAYCALITGMGVDVSEKLCPYVLQPAVFPS